MWLIFDTQEDAEIFDGNILAQAKAAVQDVVASRFAQALPTTNGKWACPAPAQIGRFAAVDFDLNAAGVSFTMSESADIDMESI